MTYARVSIVIPTFNGARDLVECLESLKKVNYPNIEIIVVDNASTDDTCQILRRDFPYVRIAQNSRNLGFAEPCNIGIRMAQGELILLLDNDVVVDPNFLGELVSVLEGDPTIGAVGPMMYNYYHRQSIWHVGGKILLRTGRLRFLGLGEIDAGQYGAARVVDYVAGCCLLASKKMYEKIGLLDGDFFAYWEDADWCSRLRKAGFKVVCVPGAKIWHKVSATSKRMSRFMLYYWVRNRFRFVRRNGTPFEFLGFVLYFFVTKFWWACPSLLIRHRDPAGLMRFCAGVRDGLLHR